MVKLKDIAARAGVSMGTASSVLNGAKNFADDTRRRVLKAAADLEYTPNLAAKLMRRGPGFHERPRTNVIAFVTRMLDATSTDPYTGSRFLLLAHLAEAKGYYMVPIFYDRNSAFACPPVQNGQVDGVVAHLPEVEIAEAVSHLAPLVLMDVPFSPELLPEAPLVNFDIRYGMHALARHMAELGHRHVATLTLNQDDPFHYHGTRCPVLHKACELAGMKLHPRLSRNRALSAATHDKVMQAFVDEAIPLIRRGEITALMMVDDGYAVEMVRRLNEAGIDIPKDVSVTGFAASSMRLAQNIPHLNLTTINYPWAALFDAALDLLIAGIDGRDHRQGEILIRPELVMADSTAAPREKAQDKEQPGKMRRCPRIFS